MKVHPLIIEDCIRRALLEDLGHGHDLTSSLLDQSPAKKAYMRARAKGILCGLDAAIMAFKLTDPSLDIETLAEDGALLKQGDNIITIQGPLASILTAERTALNFVTLLSGVATRTYQYVEEVQGTAANIVCTRKTLPGLRALQKYAVRVGGGKNHRYGLDDAILIKDNHIALCGGLENAIELSLKTAGHMIKVEVEVDTLQQLEIALGYDINAVLLDNMSTKELKQAVAMVNKKFLTEASGGIDIQTVREVALSGVDLVSVGALTHSIAALDIGLDVDL